MERPRRSKDNSPSKHETREARYMRLRADVQQWIEREQEKKHAKERYDPHTNSINPLHLTETDLDFWEEIQRQKQGQEFPMSVWQRYNAEAQAEMRSKENFRAAMGNKVAVIIAQNRIEKSQG